MFKEIFVISDIHGYYDKMIEALNKEGFDPSNENHWLISCGDNFDRGDQPQEVMNYLMNLPRKILIFGNHEDLFKDACNRGFPYPMDFSNGTYQTIKQLGGMGNFEANCWEAKNKTDKFFGQMVNYFETESYIFVHGWIPDVENWREAHWMDWRDARWSNGMMEAESGLIIPNKTIVCGHYHTSWGHCNIEGVCSEFGEDAIFDPYFNEGIIAIDACTAFSNQVNVLHIADNFLGE